MEPANSLAGHTLVARYQVKRLLGEGGMGTVYLAEQKPLGRDVVVKVLRDDLSRDPAFLERFEREARAISHLTHPNVVSIYDFGTNDDGVPFVAMEYLQGETLGARIRELGPLGERRALAIALGVVRALAEVHAVDVIHRDLKPDNVFLVAGHSGIETVKVLDFGLVKVLKRGDDADRDSPASVNRMLGTPGYMSPEQMAGRDVGPRADLFSLGLVWWEMLTGQVPFDDEPDHIARTYRMSVEPIPPPTSIVEGLVLGEGHEALLMEMLSRHAEDRPVDGLAVLDRLRHIAPHPDSPPDDLRARPRSSPPGVPRSMEPGSTDTPTKKERGRRAADTPTRDERIRTPAASSSAPKSGEAAAPPATVPENAPAGAKTSRFGLAIAVFAVVAGLVWAQQRWASEVFLDPPASSPTASPVVEAPVAEPSAPAPPPARFEIRSTPPGATVIREDTGEQVGVTPLGLELDGAARTATYRIERAGYRAVTGVALTGASIDVTLDPTARRAPAPVAPRTGDGVAEAPTDPSAIEEATGEPGAQTPAKDSDELRRTGVLNPFER